MSECIHGRPLYDYCGACASGYGNPDSRGTRDEIADALAITKKIAAAEPTGAQADEPRTTVANWQRWFAQSGPMMLLVGADKDDLLTLLESLQRELDIVWRSNAGLTTDVLELRAQLASAANELHAAETELSLATAGTRSLWKDRCGELTAQLASALQFSKRDGKFLDDLGCCKVCDGEIPDGHTDDCDMWRQEKRFTESLQKLSAQLASAAAVLQAVRSCHVCKICALRASAALSSEAAANKERE